MRSDAIEKPTRRAVHRGLIGAATLLSLPAMSRRGAAADQVTMRVGSDSPIHAPHTASAVTLKQDIERATGGRVKVTIFPDSQLGSNEVMSNSVKAGTLDAVVTDVAIMSAAVPEADVFVLPFLFADSAQMLRAAAGPLGAMLKPKLAKAFACEILGFSTDGAHNMWNGKHAAPTPADFAGIKMRVSPSKIQRDTYSALGAIPTPLPFSEVYTSLQTGVVDGADFAPVDMVELKLYQVTKYLTLTRHFSSLSVLIVGDKFLAKLSEADRDAVRAAGAAAVEAQTKAVFAAEQDALATLRAKGIQIVEMADPKAFRTAVEPVYKNNEGRVSADLVALARQTA